MKPRAPVPSSSTSKPSRPQVANLIDRDVFAKLDANSKLFLMSNFGSHAFQDWCRKNLEKIKNDMAELAPRADWTTEEFVQLSNDMRLIWRFWTDLLQYAEEFKPE